MHLGQTGLDWDSLGQGSTRDTCIIRCCLHDYYNKENRHETFEKYPVRSPSTCKIWHLWDKLKMKLRNTHIFTSAIKVTPWMTYNPTDNSRVRANKKCKHRWCRTVVNTFLISPALSSQRLDHQWSREHRRVKGE